MAENPLLPNKKLRELYALMQRARALGKAPSTAPRFEAILAATLMHVEPGDFVSPPPGAPAAALLAAERTTARTRKKPTPKKTIPLPAHHRLATAAGIAHGLKLAATGRFAVFYTDAGPASARTEAGWEEALAYATAANLPLLVVCADIAGAPRSPNPQAISWQSMAKLSKRARFPVLTVDGSDAVAVYRVMQESAHRARQGDGTAVIWCILPRTGDQTTAAADPIRNMKRYLEVRKLLPNAKAKKRLR